VCQPQFDKAFYFGQAPPFAAHSFTYFANCSCAIGIALRPSPGCHPQATSSSLVMWWTISSIDLWLFCWGSLI